MRRDHHQCPRVDGIGNNVNCGAFNEDLHCHDDSYCDNGQICCRDKCFKTCMTPILGRNLPKGRPFPMFTSSRAGACVFDPTRNCVQVLKNVNAFIIFVIKIMLFTAFRLPITKL